jgi:hypothetical protein
MKGLEDLSRLLRRSILIWTAPVYKRKTKQKFDFRMEIRERGGERVITSETWGRVEIGGGGGHDSALEVETPKR